jgi:O-succinylbenzoate synthase
LTTATSPIERVVLTHLQIPLKEPFRISGGEVAIKDAILVTLETSSGIAQGESSPMAASFGYSDDTPEGCWDDLERAIAPGLLGRTVDSTAAIAEIASGWSGSRFAAAGAETALWDLLGQAHHATIAGLLGAIDEQVGLGVQSGLAVGLYPSIVELLKAIETHLDEGYRRVKIKIQPGSDVELVRAVRQHLGDIPLMVDANGAYTATDIDVFRQLDEFDLLMFEQPMAPDDIDGSAELQKAVVTPVCLDESAETPEKTAEAIRRGACRIVNLKIQRVGGLGPARVIHDLCHQAGVACWVGTMPELGIGQAAGIHLAALANCRYPTDVEPSARWFVDDYVAPPLELASPGLFSVPTRPGLGFQVDPAKLRRYQVRQAEFTTSTTA